MGLQGRSSVSTLGPYRASLSLERVFLRGSVDSFVYISSGSLSPVVRKQTQKKSSVVCSARPQRDIPSLTLFIISAKEKTKCLGISVQPWYFTTKVHTVRF